MLKIFAGNLSFETTEAQIKEAITRYFAVEEVVLVSDDEGKPKGFAFVFTRDEARAAMALRRMGKPLINGRRVYFKAAHGKKKGTAPPQRGNRPMRGGRPMRPRRPKPRPNHAYTPPVAAAPTTQGNSEG